MALNIEGQKCPICNSYLFDDDDVVFCPICGAPHHRDCYKAVGHCGLEHTHGTDKQYDIIKKINEEKKEEAKTEQNNEQENKGEICPNCKNKLTSDMLVCPYCGRPRNVRVFSLDLLGGVNPDTDLGDGITAKEARDFVQVNTQRYIPKFEELKSKKFSWNWAAFLFPEGWFLSRKMYKTGALLISLIVATQICLIPLFNILNTAVFSSYEEYLNYFVANAHSFDKFPLILAFLSAAIMLVIRIFSGLKGDTLYKNHTIEKLKELKNAEEKELKLRKFGGVNILAFLLGVIITTYLPEILAMFF